MRKKSLAAVAVAAVVAVALLAAAAFGAFARGGHQSAAGARIGVHGAWKIVVKSPDGRVVAVRRFHNALLAPSAVRNVLGGTTTAGWWEIGLSNSASFANSPCTANGSASNCTVVPTGHETGFSLFGGHIFGGLTTANAGAGLELKGQVFADQSGTIDKVSTALFQCQASVAHSACDSTNWTLGQTFSGTTITPLSVVAGQQVLVTVDFTFTTA